MIIKAILFISLLSVLKTGKSQNISSQHHPLIQYLIKGKIKGASDGSFVILKHYGVDKKPDTSFVKNEKFKFSGKINEPIFSTLQHGYGVIDLILEKEIVNVYAEEEDFSIAIIDSKGYNNRQLKQISYRLQPILDSLSYVSDQIDKLNRDTLGNNISVIKPLQEQLNKHIQNLTDIIIRFIKKDSESISAAGSLLYWCQVFLIMDKVDFKKVYGYYNYSFKQTIYGNG